MRNKKSKRPNSQRKNSSNRRSRERRRFLFESLESRIVLAGVPTLIDLNPSGASAPSDFTPVGDITYFVANDGTHGRELWKTDGTVQGTALVKDIATGSTYQSYYGYVPDSSSPQQLVEFNGELYFVADDGINGQELWKSDGTSAGTVMVRDINPGSGYQYPYPDGPLQSFPRDLAEVNGRLFFSAEDTASGAELWASDGTTGGTVLVSDIFPGSHSDNYGTYANSSNVEDLVNVNGTLFFTADDGTNGRELWKSNGTASGTMMVKDLFTGTYPYYSGNYYYGQYPNSSSPSKLTAVGGLLFFVARDANGLELWRSDGTDAGTFMTRDIRSGSGDAFTDGSSLIGVGNTLFFTADDGVVGDELWKSDGTAAGTVLIKDIEPGGVGILSTYVGFTEVNGTLFFSSHDGGLGRELWKTDGTEAGTVLVKDINPGTDYYGGPNNAYPFYMKNLNGTLYFSALSADTGRELWQSDGTDAGTMLVADAVPGSSGLYPKNLERAGDTLVFSGDAGSGHELYVLLPEAEATTNSARITIFVDSQPVTIPANIGVNSDSSMAAVFTESTSGEVISEIGTTVTLGNFFEIWRTNAGLAGNNSNAILSGTQLLGNVENGANTVQMFVNGQVSQQFGDYVLQNGDEVVLVYGDNPVVSLNTNFGAIVIELFETEAPGTVDNFLNYVNDGDYLNSFFHRSVTDFVVQVGGFTTTSTSFSSTSQFTSIPTDPSILNEPGFPNVRTTVAMAKTSDPDSATSQFFVNLSDDNTFLDDTSNSGGFTVFGQVLDMTTPDEIAALPINNVDGGTYAELPISASNQLAVIQSVTGQGEITGVKFSDDNANGVQDVGEAGLAGVSIFIDANSNGVLDPGEITTTTDADGHYLLQVEAGTYTLRSEVSSGKVTTVPSSSSSYSVTVEIGREAAERDFGEAALPAPTGVDLLASSDSGTQADDNLTKFNNAGGASLQFEVTGVTPGAEVKLFSDGVQIGAASATSSTVSVVTDGLTSLSDGSHSITATQSISGGESVASSALTMTIDTAAPAAPTSTAPDIAQAEQAYSFDADSPDEGQTGVVYSLSNAPAGMAIDSGSGVVTWTPTADQAVPQTFSIEVSDSAGNTASQSVDLTVLGVIPAFPESYTVAEDTTLTIDAANGVLANDGDENSGTLTASVVAQPTNGSLTFNADGSFTYTPNSDFFGDDSFTYLATDGVDDTNVAKVTIHVTGINDATVAAADSYTATEDTSLTIDAAQGVLANDTDVDGDTLTATLSSQAANGSVTLNADGSFTYTPNAEFSGGDSFTYTVSDGTITSSPVTVNLSVTNVADPPTAAPDAYSVNEDETLTIDAASGLLFNDTDPDSTVLTALLSTQPTSGSVSLNSDGSFTYTPNANFFGSDSFTYVASDGVSNSAAATVIITVNSQADAPTANDDTATSDGGATTIDVIANDSSEPDGSQTLTIVSVTQGTSGGSVAISGTAVSYTPASGFGGAETFTYTIQDSDGLTDTATVTVSVSEVANNNNSFSGFVYIDVDGDGTRDSSEFGVPGAQITLTGTDVSGEQVTRSVLTTDAGFYSFEELPAGTYQVSERQPMALSDGLDGTTVPDAATNNDAFTSISLSGGQSFVENNFGEASILPQYINITWFFASAGSTESLFRETIAMGEQMAGNNSLAASIRAGASDVPADGNFSPVAANDAYSVNQDNSLSVAANSGVLVNDTDADGDSLTAIVLTQPANGTLSFSGDGSFTYAPNTAFTGSDSFTYQASDGTNLSNSATVTITVNAANANTANVFSINENSSAGTAVGTLTPEGELGNSVVFQVDDPNLNPLLELVADDHFSGGPSASVVLIEYMDLSCPHCQEIHSVVQQLESDSEGELLVVRRHLLLFDSSTDSFVFPNSLAAARAAEAASLQGMFNEMVDLLFVNQADWNAATDPSTFFNQYAEQLGLDLTLFASDQADPAIDARIQRDRDAAASLGLSSTPSFFINGQATPNPGTVDAFAPLIQDALDASTDVFRVHRQTGEITVRNSDALDFETTPSFTLTVDAKGLNGTVSTINATINLIDVNEAVPVANADNYTVNENGSLVLAAANGVLLNDTDADGNSLTAQLLTSTTNGTLLLEADGSVAYIPNPDFSGTDFFTYSASDGTSTSAAATVTITVNSLSESAPTANADSYTVGENNTLTVDATSGVLSNDSDADGNSLTAQLITSPTNGTLSLNSDGSFNYVPNTDFSGTDFFTYSASDSALTSATAMVTITVNPGNNAPLTSVDSYTLEEDGSLTIDATSGVLANDSDPEGATLTAVLVEAPQSGTVSLNSDGSFTYTPVANFSATDAFSYAASDGEVTSGATTVTLLVQGTEDTPVGVNDSYSVEQADILNVPVANGVLANDSDADADTLTALLLANPANGALTLNDDGSFVYEPNDGFVGTDTFTYQANDGFFTSNTVTVTITVSSVNDLPITQSDAYSVVVDGSLLVDAANGVLANDSDADGDTLSSVLFSTTNHGTLSLQADGSFSYVADANFEGTDSFTYTAADGTSESSATTVTITVGEPSIAGVRLEVTAEDGTPITSIVEGESFVLNVYAADLRDVPQGVFAAYLDLIYDTSLVSLNGTPAFSTEFANSRTSDTTSGGLIDELGAFVGSTQSTGVSESLVVSIPFKSDVAGTAQFATDAADVLPAHDFLLFGENNAIPQNRIAFESALLDIVATGAAEGESAGETFASAADALFSGEEDWLSP